MKNIGEMSMEELAAYVCSELEKEGIETVLSGGSCVEIYSQGKYTSDDIDLIDRYNGGHTKIKNIMISMGFREHNRYFVHNDTSLFLEFPRGPLGVGDAPVYHIAEKEEETGILKLLTPTDCIKDRLAAYFHWDDLQSLEQALWVSEKNEFNIDSVKAWAEHEKESKKFEIFMSRLK